MNKTKIFVLGLTAMTVLAFAVPSLAMAEDNTATPGARPGLLRQIFAKNGRVAIGSGVVASKSTGELTVTRDGKTYTVLVDGNTKFRRRFWGGGSLDEIQVGDTVNVIGKWTDDSHTTIQAVLVRDISIQKRAGVFFGTVTSLTSDGWVMATISRGNQTVTVSSSTKFVNRKGETISQADIKVGDRVRVRGLWDKANSTVTEVSGVKDFAK